MPKLVNRVGERFGRLLVLELLEKRIKGKVYYRCICDCGNEVITGRAYLTAGKVKSCGCLRKEINSLPVGEASFNRLYKGYQDGARKRKINFELSRDEFRKITSSDCYYCGKPPRQIQSEQNFNGDYVYNGIDRVNNNDGYITSNVVPCCEKCNRAKLAMTLDEFTEWIINVYDNLIRNEMNYTKFANERIINHLVEKGSNEC